MRTERTAGAQPPGEQGAGAESEAHALGALAAELSAAATPDEVAHALVERMPPLLGAVGGALGLVQDDELVIVDPGGVRRATLPARLRIPLTAQAPIARAALTGEPAFANSREEMERDYPDGARLADYAHSALAVPLLTEDRVVGSMGFPFDAAGRVDADLIALAQLAAALGGQALERAQLYDRERSLREGLDRIARLAPRFAGERTMAVMEAICGEALATFDGDVAQLWALADEEVVLVYQEPPDDDCPPGTRSRRVDVTGVEESLARMEPTFAQGPPREGPVDTAGPFRLLSDRTALQIPIVVAGEVGRILRVIWHDDVPTDRPETLILARRLADHAGLALEHAERRRAQEAADRSADDTRRLLDATEALGAATTPELVGAAALEEAKTTLGSAAGALLRLTGDHLVLVASSGFAPEELAGWERFDRRANAPVGRAIEGNELLVHRTRAELAVDFPEIAAATRFGAWLSIPLSVAGRTIGAIALSFAEGRTFRPADLEYAESLARQAALALDRTLLLEDEQRARARAEQLASDLSRLHAFATSLAGAASTSEVGALLCDQVKAILGASACAVYVPLEVDQLQLLHGSGSLTPGVEPTPDGPTWPSCLDAALNPTSSVWLATAADWQGAEPYAVLRTAGDLAVAAVPLTAGGQPSGLLVAWFSTDEFPEETGKRLLETMVRQATEPLERARLLESERAARLQAQTAEQRTRTLQEVAERMSRAATPRDVAEVVRISLEGLLAAETVEVFKLDEGRGRAELLAPGVMRPAPVVGLDTLALTMPSADLPPDEQPRSSYAYPLTSGVRTPGAVRLTFDAPVAIDDESSSMIQAITRQAGQALDRSLLYEDEQRARTRTERLQALTAAFSRALTLEDVATVFVDDALVGLRADGVMLGVIGGDERETQPLASRGYPEVVVRPLLAVTSSRPSPASVAREGSASYFETATQLGARYPELTAALEAIDHETFAFLPVWAGSRPLGVAALSWRGQAELDDDGWSFLQALTTQCGLALDRAARYEGERSIAETLQRSVLPRSIPVLEGVRIAARYLPGTTALDVGGDWFDTLMLPDGRLGFAVGDVVGKGVRAAATMAQLRNGMRALTLDESDPGRTMTKLNRLLEGITDAPFATVAFLVVDPKAHTASLVSAGHLPPLVIDPSGATRYAEEGRNLPLGVDADMPLEAAELALEPGSIVVLYTDGLVERPDRSIDDGLERLAAVDVPADRDPEKLADIILEQLLEGDALRDDVALLVLEIAGEAAVPLELSLPAETASLTRLRSSVSDWLVAERVPPDDARDILLAVWEAATNAVEHGHREGGTVTLHGAIVGDRVRIEIADEGRWQEPREREDRGLGLRVIRSLMTDVELEQSEAGTRIVMERSLRRRTAGNGESGDADAH
ncbi:MAG TPA: SpoIIE family protein phosphatase [Gaiella sp.]|nr:SpoIIE family protein phosphatase [Gaiella sp.]